MLARVWQEACHCSRLSRLPKAAMQRLDQAEMQPVKKLSRARPRAPSKSRHFVDARNSGSRARVLGAVDRQARSQLRCCLRRLWTNDRPRVLLDAGVAVRATKRLPRAARGDKGSPANRQHKRSAAACAVGGRSRRLRALLDAGVAVRRRKHAASGR